MSGLPQSGTANYNVFQQEDNTTRGIKGFYFRDGPRGVNLNANSDGKSDYSTAFPVAMARGAAFDDELEYQIGQAIGDEMLASGNTMMLAPTINILRHPAWGRAQETYGEDVVPARPPRQRVRRRRAAVRRRLRQALRRQQHRERPRDARTR